MRKLGKFRRKFDIFGCRDIFFSIINESINSLEEIVEGFLRESETLLYLAREMTVKERKGMMTRGFVAKEISNNFSLEIKNKTKMVKSLLKLEKLMSYAARARVKFLHSRMKEVEMRFERAIGNIDLFLDVFE